MSSRCTGAHPGGYRIGAPWTTMLGCVLGLLVSSHALAAWNLDVPAAQISRDAYDQHMLMLYWCIGIGLVVFGAMFYSIFRYRNAAGNETVHFHRSTFAEVLWTVVPSIILVTMAIPATNALITSGQGLELQSPSSSGRALAAGPIDDAAERAMKRKSAQR